MAPGEIIPRDAQHIYYGQGELTGTLTLEPGEHVLRLQLSNGAHVVPEEDQYRDQITVTVTESTRGTSHAVCQGKAVLMQDTMKAFPTSAGEGGTASLHDEALSLVNVGD